MPLSGCGLGPDTSVASQHDLQLLRVKARLLGSTPQECVGVSLQQCLGRK
jgi:hypothetical protein